MPVTTTAWPPSLGSGGHGATADPGPGDDLTSNWSSLIGIITAIVGNMLIALALNVQRYAHIQLHRERQRSRQQRQQVRQKRNGRHAHETDPLLLRPADNDDDNDNNNTVADTPDSPSSPSSSSSSSDTTTSPPSSYLQSPYWWLGQVLITVGEMGNFLAYGFAPASIVSPLGVVALISNCVVAPILFKEAFRTRDFWGVVVATAGVVTVVLSANQQETKLNPHDVWDAITTPAFEVYVAVTAALIALLMWASPRYGHRTILIDLGLVGLFGAYTVLATKGVSSLLSSTLFGAFLTPMTYVLLVILLATAVMQVRYVNKALQRFDSTQVIPVQFVLFTLSVIVGSAVLYRDFERTTAEQAAKFVGGCLLTFSGVFVITSGREVADVEEDGEGEEEGGDGESGLAEEAEAEADGPENGRGNGVDGTDDTPADGTRRSSRRSSSTRRSTTRVHYAGRPYPAFPAFTADAGMGVRTTTATTTSDAASASSAADPAPAPPYGVPLFSISSPSFDDGAPSGGRPGIGVSAFSADSVLQVVAGESASTQPPRHHSYHHLLSTTTTTTTPSAYYHHARNAPPAPMISPSPLLSATVNVAMADTILKHMDGSGGSSSGGGGGGGGSGGVGALSLGAGRRPSTRRMRPGLAASLFVPQGELSEGEGGSSRREEV